LGQQRQGSVILGGRRRRQPVPYFFLHHDDGAAELPFPRQEAHQSRPRYAVGQVGHEEQPLRLQAPPPRRFQQRRRPRDGQGVGLDELHGSLGRHQARQHRQQAPVL